MLSGLFQAKKWPKSYITNIVKISRYFLNIALMQYFQMMQYIAFAIFHDKYCSPLIEVFYYMNDLVLSSVLNMCREILFIYQMIKTVKNIEVYTRLADCLCWRRSSWYLLYKAILRCLCMSTCWKLCRSIKNILVTVMVY